MSNEEILLSDILDWNRNMMFAAASLKQLLDQIDFSAEILPASDSHRLTQLFASLKGDSLNEYEEKVLEEFTNGLA